MPLPKLSPLQSRLAASLIATVMLLLLYLAFASPHFAYAADVDSIKPEDHNHERLLERPILEYDYGDEVGERADGERGEEIYEAEFLGFDRGIIGRATLDMITLINNRMDQKNIQQGQVMSYMFANSSLWGPYTPPTPGLPSQIVLQDRNFGSQVVEDEEIVEETEERLKSRQSSAKRTLYITVTTCDQPAPVSNATTDPPPQLQVYISQTANNTTPGPTQNGNGQQMVELEDGYLLYTTNATGDVFVGVYAMNDTTYSGIYNVQVAMSIDKPYHYYWNSTDPNLFPQDSDDQSVLLYTDPFTSNSSDTSLIEKWMDTSPPYVLFASDENDTSLIGLQHSYCGLQLKAQMAASRPGQTTSNVVTGMSLSGTGTSRLPKQQFYMNGLTPGKTYNAILAMNGNSTDSGDGVAGGGGQVFTMTSFTTLTDGNCALIYDLTFCDQTAYSVPSNPTRFSDSNSIASFYDNTTSQIYENFLKVLSLTPCETTSSAQYSLARTCEDCKEAYKAWLCSVSIPRCTDYSSTLPFLQPRAMGQPFPNGTFLPEALLILANATLPINASRNATIDDIIQPGPYKEILPCDDICYNLVQSCPASIGFSCPRPGDLGFENSYGQKPMTGVDAQGRQTNASCNYPGVSLYLAAGNHKAMMPSVGILCLVVLGTVMLL